MTTKPLEARACYYYKYKKTRVVEMITNTTGIPTLHAHAQFNHHNVTMAGTLIAITECNLRAREDGLKLLSEPNLFISHIQ